MAINLNYVFLFSKLLSMKKLLTLSAIFFASIGLLSFAASEESAGEKIFKKANVLSETLIQKIEKQEISFNQAKTLIEWGIDSYLEKVKKLSKKELPNLFLFEGINSYLTAYDLFNSKNILEYNWTKYKIGSFTKRDLLRYTDNKSIFSDLGADRIQTLVIPGTNDIVYLVRVGIDWEKKNIERLYLAYWEGKDQVYVDGKKNKTTKRLYENTITPYWIYYLDQQGIEEFSQDLDIKTQSGMVVYAYIVPKNAQNLKLTFENNMNAPFIELSKIAEFKYNTDSIMLEIDKLTGEIPFCVRALQLSSGVRETKMIDCKNAYKGNFTEGMPDILFRKWNIENEFIYWIEIDDSHLGTNYCAETVSWKRCLWTNNGKISSVTSYNYKQ